jgi:hypothetical protein
MTFGEASVLSRKLSKLHDPRVNFLASQLKPTLSIS